MTTTMTGAYLPGGSRVELRPVPVPSPGHGQVLLRVRASTICGSDLRAIYREHLGHGPEAYQGVVAGHEPAGEVVEVGPGVTSLTVGDRVAVYHISGCGTCPDCRMGYLDGACCACGFGTAYEALCRIGLSGKDRLLIVGTGPVGMAAGLLAGRLGVTRRVGGGRRRGVPRSRRRGIREDRHRRVSFTGSAGGHREAVGGEVQPTAG